MYQILSSTTVFDIYNNQKSFWASNQHIRRISEGDTGDWSNDAENSALTSQE